MKNALPHIIAEDAARALYAYYWTEDDAHRRSAIRHLTELAALMGFKLVPNLTATEPADDAVADTKGAAK